MITSAALQPLTTRGTPSLELQFSSDEVQKHPLHLNRFG